MRYTTGSRYYERLCSCSAVSLVQKNKFALQVIVCAAKHKRTMAFINLDVYERFMQRVSSKPHLDLPHVGT